MTNRHNGAYRPSIHILSYYVIYMVLLLFVTVGAQQSTRAVFQENRQAKIAHHSVRERDDTVYRKRVAFLPKTRTNKNSIYVENIVNSYRHSNKDDNNKNKPYLALRGGGNVPILIDHLKPAVNSWIFIAGSLISIRFTDNPQFLPNFMVVF